MHGLTDYITDRDWEDTFTLWFVLIDDCYQQLYGAMRLRPSGPEPAFSDSEVITLSLICATYFHGDEELTVAFVRQHYRALFPKLLSKSRFNRRRRALSLITEEIRRRLSDPLIDPEDDVRLIDSAPIPVCTYGRSRACMTVQGAEYASWMPSRKAPVYGLRLSLTVTTDQVIDQWLLAPASEHDSRTGQSLLEAANQLYVIGDNAYHSPWVGAQLKDRHGIQLIAPPQRGHDSREWPKAWRRQINRLRRRVESALAVLTTVFDLERPKSRSLSGFIARTATRLLAYTLSFYATSTLETN